MQKNDANALIVIFFQPSMVIHESYEIFVEKRGKILIALNM
ncbi:hypothetical protein ACU063_08595 [Paenibacillus sp. M.A.Huq-81]